MDAKCNAVLDAKCNAVFDAKCNAAIDAKCKKDHANVMSPEFKACVTLETKNASLPKTEVEGEGSAVAPTEAPAAPTEAPKAPVAPVAPAKK